MGYTGFEVQYYTAPIYVCAFVAILAFCFSSDYFKERAFHLATASGLAIVCFAILIGVLNHTGRYVLLCFGVAGVYAACECCTAGFLGHGIFKIVLTRSKVLLSAFTFQTPVSLCALLGYHGWEPDTDKA